MCSYLQRPGTWDLPGSGVRGTASSLAWCWAQILWKRIKVPLTVKPFSSPKGKFKYNMEKVQKKKPTKFKPDMVV